MRLLLYLGIILVLLGIFHKPKMTNVVLLTPRTIQEGQGLYNENLPVDYISSTLESTSKITTELALNKWTNRDFLSQTIN